MGNRITSLLNGRSVSNAPSPAREPLSESDFRDCVVELAYEEYCRRREAGEPVLPAEFARRFGPLEAAVLRQIEVHEYLTDGDGGGEEESPFADLQAGRIALGFELVEEIGRGAFSRVFVARDRRLARRRVVVKFCSFGQEEAETIALLAHPNIVPVLSVHSDAASGVTGICMPYLGRLTLQHVLDAGPGDHALRSAARRAEARSVRESLDLLARLMKVSLVDAVALVASDVLSALAHVHAMGFCHGDVKPSNVLLANDGCARLLDFNLANPRASLRRSFGGTLPYMPPEQLAHVRDRKRLRDLPHGPRTDLFGLGATLYHVLGGRPPFGERLPDEPIDSAIERLLSAHSPAPIRSVNPEVDPVLATAIHDCLSRDPGDRPVSASALARCLAGRFR